MSVKLVSQSMVDEFTGGGPVGCDFLLGSIGDKITQTLTFSISWGCSSIFCFFTTGVKTIERKDGKSFITDDEFKVGDSITITGTTSNNISTTITALTDSLMTVAAAITSEKCTTTTIGGTTPVTAIDYLWNIIPNSAQESYDSLVDSDAVQIYNCNTVNAAGMASTAMTALGTSKGYQLGSATIDDVSFVGTTQILVITHIFYITPLFLAGQFANLQGKYPVSAFDKGECMKLVTRINAKFLPTDPNVAHTNVTSGTLQFNLKNGTTGWFNEFLNGYAANYTLTSIAYVDTATGLAVSSLQNFGTTDVEIHLASAAAFTAGQKVLLSQIYCPNDPADYQRTLTNFIANFRFDRVLLTEGAAAVNGDQFGTDAQSITNAQAIRIGASDMKIIYRFNPATAYKTFINAKDSTNQNYLIFATVQKAAVAAIKNTDRNAVICDARAYAINQDDSTLFGINGAVEFRKGPGSVTWIIATNVGRFMAQDQVFATIQFLTKSTAKINNIRIAIEAEKSGQTSVELLSDTFAVGGVVPDCNGIQNINLSKSANFTYASDDLWNNITFKRVPGLDVAATSTLGYQINYPFKIRWEQWQSILEAVKCFPAGTNDWAAYLLASGWTINFNVYADMETVATAVVTQFKHITLMPVIKDINAVSAQGIKACISTFVIDPVTGIETSLDGQIATDQTTYVRATFTGDFSTFPTGYDTFVGYIRLDSDTVGGQSFIREINSANAPESGSPFGSSAATLTQTGTTKITVLASIDGTLLDDSIPYYVSSRLDVYSASVAGLLQETYGDLLTEKNEGLILNP